jgi:hypothetical protein
MENESILVQLTQELDKYTLSEKEKKEILEKVLQKYANLLMQSAINAVHRNKGSMPVIDLEDVKRAAELVGLTSISLEEVTRSVKEAVNWLLQKGPNGTWGWWSMLDPPDLKDSIVKIWSTAIAIRSLLRAGLSPMNPQIVKGVGWLMENRVPDQKPCWALLPRIYDNRRYSNYLLPNTYETSCVLLTLQEARKVSSCDKRIVRDGIENLVNHQRKRGFWPIFLYKEQDGRDDSDIGATSLALTAVSRARKNEVVVPGHAEAINKAAEWLRSKQRTCGSWGDVEHTLGCTTKTCDAIRALVESETPESQKTIKLGADWLLTNQSVVEDGRGWGWRKTDEDNRLIASTVENTAFAIIALLKAGQSASSVPIQLGLRWLLGRQHDGNWSEDTPRVIIALSEYLKEVDTLAKPE